MTPDVDKDFFYENWMSDAARFTLTLASWTTGKLHIIEAGLYTMEEINGSSTPDRQRDSLAGWRPLHADDQPERRRSEPALVDGTQPRKRADSCYPTQEPH